MERGEYRRRRRPPPEKVVYVLDYLPYGDPLRGIRHPLIQCIGEKKFQLIELRPVKNIPGFSLAPGERLVLEESLESEMFSFLRLLHYDDLSAAAKKELPVVLEKIVRSQEARFVDFFNYAKPISKKAHELDLLKGIGKRTLWKILEERRKKRFESFKDIEERVGIDPVKLIVERILEELSEPQNYYLFVRPPRRFQRRRWR